MEEARQLKLFCPAPVEKAENKDL